VLVQLGLDEVLNSRNTLHVSLTETIDEVRDRYDELFLEASEESPAANPMEARIRLERHRMVQSYGPGSFTVAKLDKVLQILTEHADFRPATVLVDGIQWGRLVSDDIARLKGLVGGYGAELWLTALGVASTDASQLPECLEPFAGEVDLVLDLQPGREDVAIRVLYSRDVEGPSAESVSLDTTSMRVRAIALPDDADAESPEPRRCTLYSGGAAGTEAAFGEMAEGYGMREVHFSYPGHEPVRRRGLKVLSERELRQGDVSLSYASRRMAREFEASQAFRRVLQTIWHQVSNADQVLVIGTLQEDGTVRGGTGWGGELARVWNKRLSVFDQERGGWYSWDATEHEWAPTDTPKIVARRFCGTGTRELNEAGRKAIQQVFELSFPAN